MAYGTLIICFAAVWTSIFALRADLRKYIFRISILTAPLGPLSEFWYLKDYWARATLSGHRIGIEDLLFSFFLGGVTFGIFKLIFGVGLGKQQGKTSFLFIASCITVCALCLMVLTNILGVNSIFSSIIAFSLIALCSWYLRPDLIRPSAWSGVLTVCLFLVAYNIVEAIFPGTLIAWCLKCNPTSVRIAGVNLEELLWDFAWGLAGGIVFETATTRRLIYREKPDEPFISRLISRVR